MTPVIFRSGGAGPAIVLLHAFPLNSAMWAPQIQALSGSAAWVAPDLPGFGASAQAQVVADLDELAAMIYEEARSRGIDQACVAGCSMGGYLAFALLRVAPAFVRGLALVNTKAAADSAPAKANRLALAQRVEREGCAFLIDEWPPSALSPVTLAKRPDVVETVRGMVGEATARGVIAAQHAMASRPDATTSLATIRVPTVVIHGLDDPIIAPAEAQTMARAIPAATFVGVPQAGHLPSIEQPAIVNQALLQLCSAL